MFITADPNERVI